GSSPAGRRRRFRSSHERDVRNTLMNVTFAIKWALLVWRLRLRFPRVLGRVRRLGAALRAPLPSASAAPEPAWIDAYRRPVASGMPGGSCLSRALALQGFLRDRGVAAVLRTGMRRRVGRLEGHVWVECGGRVVGDEESLVSGYTRFRHAGASG